MFTNGKPKTWGEWHLDEIIEHINSAHRRLKLAEETARNSNDEVGANELAEGAEVVKKIHERFKGIRNKKSG